MLLRAAVRAAAAVVLVVAAALSFSAVTTAESQSPPGPIGSITDETGTLAGSYPEIEAAQQRLFDATGVTLSVAFVASTNGEPIAQYGAQAAERTGLGARDALFVAAVVDGTEWLQLGPGLRDTTSANEINGLMAQFEDHLRQGDDAGGVVAVADGLAATIVPTPTPAAIPHPTAGPSSETGSTVGKHGNSTTGGGGVKDLLVVLVALLLLVGAGWLVLRLGAERRRRAAADRGRQEP